MLIVSKFFFVGLEAKIFLSWVPLPLKQKETKFFDEMLRKKRFFSEM